MDFEPLTTAEQKVKDTIDKLFGDKDASLRSIVLYSSLLQLNPDDDECREKLTKIISKIKRSNEALSKNVLDELKCCLDCSGNIISV